LNVRKNSDNAYKPAGQPKPGHILSTGKDKPEETQERDRERKSMKNVRKINKCKKH